MRCSAFRWLNSEHPVLLSLDADIATAFVKDLRKPRNSHEEEEEPNMDRAIVPYTIVNEDISDDSDPTLYIQRYIYPKRAYQVIRKEWDEQMHGAFEPRVEEDHARYWQVSTLLTQDYDPDSDEMTEVVALIQRDEEYPPVDDPEKINQNVDPCVLVVYDPEDERYKCEPTGVYSQEVTEVNELDEQAFGQVAEPFLEDAINRGVALLDRLIENSVKAGT
jgi:hypothetical protein